MFCMLTKWGATMVDAQEVPDIIQAIAACDTDSASLELISRVSALIAERKRLETENAWLRQRLREEDERLVIA